MRIAVVGVGFYGEDLIGWADGAFANYSNTKDGGDFSVVEFPDDHMCNSEYDLVVFILVADEFVSCVETVNNVVQLQKQGRDVEVFVCVESDETSNNNFLAIKELCPQANRVEFNSKWHGWGFQPKLANVYLAEQVTELLAARKRLHYMLSGKEIVGDVRWNPEVKKWAHFDGLQSD